MSGLFFFLWFVTLIAFIVYWWKKRCARLAGGADYKSDSLYLKMSKIKRIIGIVCILSFVLGCATSNNSVSPEEQARIEAQRAEKAAKAQAEKERQAMERVAGLSGADKALFDTKFNEYKGSMDEAAARDKALEDVDAAIKVREEEAAAAKKAQDEKDKVAKELATGWKDNEIESQANFEKAVHFVADHTDYVKFANADYPDLQSALKQPWTYYGKIVCISGEVGTVTQEPPGQSVAKIFGGKYFHTVIQGNFPVSIHIKGMSDHIREGQRIRVKGLIVGQTQLQNMMGGSPRGVEFVGILDQ